MNPKRLVFLFLAFSPALCAQTWQEVATPGALDYSTPRAINSDGTHLYVLGGTGNSGVHRTSDGSTWQTLNTVKGTGAYDMSLASLDFISFADGRVWVGNDPGSLTINYGYHPIHRLEPGETEWTRSAESGFPGGAFASAANGVAHDPSNGVFFAASALGGMYTSTDRTNWQRRTDGLGTGMVFGKSVFAKDGVAFLNLTGGGTYRSSDDGVTWTAAGITSTSDFIDTGSRIIAANAGTVHGTSDLGENWDSIAGLVANAPIDLTRGGNTVFATQGYNFITGVIMMNYSSTGGATWGAIPSAGLPLNFVPVRIVPHGGQLYAFGSVGPSGPSALYRVAISSLNLTPVFGIASHPKPVTTVIGKTVSLWVVAGGVEPLSYQWKLDGQAVTGETSAALLIEDAQAADSGSYTVTVTDANGATATSNAAIVSILPKDFGRVDPLLARGNLSSANDHGTLHSMSDGSMIAVRNNYAMRVGPEGDRTNVRANFGAGSGSSAPDYPVHLLDSAGRILLIPDSTPASSYKYVRRVLSTGDFANDTTFPSNTLAPTAGANTRVINAVCELPGQGYLVAGNFTEIGPHAVNRLALISYDGTTVTAFGSAPSSGTLTGVHYSAADQSVWVTGDFASWPGSTAQRIVKLTASGSVAPGWTPYVFSPSLIAATMLEVLLVQADGKALVRRTATASVQNLLRRLNPDGTFDAGFNVAELTFTGGASAATNFTRAVELPSGRIGLTGDFATYGTAACAKYCVLNSDGTLDTSFYCAVGYNNGTFAIQSLAYDPRGYLYLSNGLQTTSTGANFQGIGSIGRGVVRVFAPLPESSPGSYDSWATALPQNKRGMNDDADDDGFANVFDFLYDGSPTAPDALGPIINPGNEFLAAEQILLADVNAEVETGKTYQTVTFRIPKDMKGFVAAPQAAGEQLNFEDGSAEIHPLGSPQDDGNYQLRTYYLTPATEDISKLFWRLKITGP